MINLTIPKMTCAHCEKTISTAILTADNKAKITFDLPNKSVSVLSKIAKQTLIAVIKDAGYQAVESPTVANKGSCCGHC